MKFKENELLEMLDNKEIFKPLLNRIKRIIDHDSFYYASISTSISLLNKYNRLVKMICRHIANINYDKSLVSDQLKILMFVTDHLNNRIKKNV